MLKLTTSTVNYRSRYIVTEAKLQRRIKEGRCVGLLAAYIPWILVHEFSSRGWSTRAWSHKMQRIVHVFSRGEYLFFLRLELAAWVAAFYEQFALLPREVVEAIADTHHFDRPTVAGVRQVMTSDFKIIKTDGTTAIRSLKQLEDLETDDRVRQKLLIDRLYWANYVGESDWAVVTEDASTPGLDWNIEWMAGMRSLDRVPHLRQFTPEAEVMARAWLLEDGCTIDEAGAKLGEKFGGRATGTTLLRHLFATGAFHEVDMTVRLDPDRDLPLLRRRLE